jgi:aspartokinase
MNAYIIDCIYFQFFELKLFYFDYLVQVAIVPNCSILAAVGQKMASTPGVSATLFNALAKVRALSMFALIIMTVVLISTFYFITLSYF